MRDRSPGFTFSALQQRCYLIISDRALSKAAAKNLVFDTFSNRQNIQVTTHDPKGLHLLGDHCEGIITSFSFGASLVVERVNICLQWGRPSFDPWIGKVPWRRKWQLTSILLPGKSHGQRSLVGYSP